ncbi:WAT1-related protein At2g39510-like [Humulus lupulus]|uniref:WAT1-related protein At2g39510-like n=1 Tax=Humulus lupulus TaxID=3486 RepID=UPI002B40F41A|nr:WAT1-related protein At2g39510-like [Humulus lupulus]
MSTKYFNQKVNLLRPFIGIIVLQFGYAGMSIVSKFALDRGMSLHVLVVYRHVVAAVVIAPFSILMERKTRPKMTSSVFIKILLLGLLEPVIDQNLFYTGMKYTTATFASAMCNILPAFAFIMAWIFRLEKVDIQRIHSQAKLLGTLLTVVGAMVMTLVNGSMLDFPWTKENNDHGYVKAATNENYLKGGLMLTTGSMCWSSFIILQAITLKSYPAELSLTALICLMGAIEGSIAAIILEWGNPAAWSIRLDSSLIAALYSGIVCSGFGYYIQGVVMKDRGPVFATAFNPIGMIIVAILSSFIFSEILYLGRVIGAVIIVLGLYMVLWGKTKDHLPSETSEKVSTTIDEHIIVMNENLKVSKQDNVADYNDIRETPSKESV